MKIFNRDQEQMTAQISKQEARFLIGCIGVATCRSSLSGPLTDDGMEKLAMAEQLKHALEEALV